MDVAGFAAQLAMDAVVLGGMLAGRTSIDVETAVRIARSLQLPAERIMQMQVRSDFASMRGRAALQAVGLLRPATGGDFPIDYLRGCLGRSSQGAGADASLFFREDVPAHIAGDDYAGLHALWRNDRLRVYDGAGAVAWMGPVLHDFDGRILLPYVRGATWQSWFAAACRADLAPGTEHAASLTSARSA